MLIKLRKCKDALRNDFMACNAYRTPIV